MGGKKHLLHLDNRGVVGVNGKGKHCHQLTFVWVEAKEQLGTFVLASAYPSHCKFRCPKGVHGSVVVANPTPTPITTTHSHVLNLTYPKATQALVASYSSWALPPTPAASFPFQSVAKGQCLDCASTKSILPSFVVCKACSAIRVPG